MKRSIILHAAQIATPQGFSGKKGREMGEIRLIEDGAVYSEDGVIRLVGTTSDVLKQLELFENDIPFETINAESKCLIPGFVDSHTHFIFGGYRAGEFIRRLEGAAYLDILSEGGGIQSTVRSTRSSSKRQLVLDGLKRLDAMLMQGVTTLEGKSGYGLDLDCEIKQLYAMRECALRHPVEIAVTYLGAHAVPEEFKGDTDGYVDFMIDTVLPQVSGEGLAEFCDVFCEEGVFTVEQSRRLLKAAAELGLDAKIHADEIVPLGGAELAASLHAVSADHLLMATDEGIKQLATASTVATLLPCTAYCLGKPYAPARRMIDGGCCVALASDFNPGSCFTNSIPLILSLAAIYMGMTPEEILTAITLNGAAAIGRAGRIGSIEPGKQADMLLLEYPDYRFLIYHSAVNIVDTVIKNGELCYKKPTLY